MNESIEKIKEYVAEHGIPPTESEAQASEAIKRFTTQRMAESGIKQPEKPKDEAETIKQAIKNFCKNRIA